MTGKGGPPGWDPHRSEELYRVADWGQGYFAVSEEGTVLVRPRKDPTEAIDLLEVVESLRERELDPPVLLRFPGITRHRMEELGGAFKAAIQEAEYTGSYTCVYPIKVNQARHVCEEVRDIAAQMGFGLEVGTKPELLAALALTDGHDDMPIVCNGFKDEEYLEVVVRAARLGRTILPVMEQLFELPILIRLIKEHDSEVKVGLRVRLTGEGSGRWADSSGHRGKFGLTAGEALAAVERLRAEGLLDRLSLLHCHIGSQVSDIRRIKNAVSELTHVYTELVRLGAPLTTLDLGGGLGVDYDGTHTPSDNSVNYDMSEYARDLVYRIAGACDQAGAPHPDLITESGRAITAYSSVLVCEVVGRRAYDPVPDLEAIRRSVDEREGDAPQPLLDLLDAAERVDTDDPEDLFHDSIHAQEEASSLFRLGYISIEDQTAAESISGFVWRRVLDRAGWPPPEELEVLTGRMSDLLFVNVSLFQSLPDAWAIDQVFPIMPIHRLEERPTRRAVLADMTCDSDGKIDRFIGADGPERTVEVHARNGSTGGDEPYYLGVFLAGAYQETLGDLHNLLGDTHAVHVEVDSEGRWNLETVVEGDTVREVLTYVQFDTDEMRATMRKSIERAIKAGRITVAEGNNFRRCYVEALEGYTYPE